MPTVKRYTSTVSPIALPRVRRTAHETSTSMGADLASTKARAAGAAASLVANAGQSVASVFHELDRKAKNDADELALTDAENRLASWELTRLYTPSTGALAVSGREAFGLPEQVSADFNKMAGEIESGLSTDRQRLAFSSIRAKREITVRRAILQHVDGELKKFDDAETKNTLGNALSLIAVKYREADAIDLELDRGIEAIKTNAKRQGYGAETTARQLGDFTSAAHHTVVIGLLQDQDFKGAKYYFEQMSQVEGQINGPVRQQIKDALEKGERANKEEDLRKKTQLAVDALLTQPTSFESKRAEVRKQYEGELEDRIMNEIEREEVRSKVKTREADEKRFERIALAVEKKGSWNAVSTFDREGLSLQERNAIDAVLDEQTRGVTDRVSNENVYSMITALAHSTDQKDRTAFVSMSLGAFRSALSNADYRRVQDLQSSVRRGDHEAAKKLLTNQPVQNAMVSEALTSMGLDPNPPQPGTKGFRQADADRVNAFRREVREAVRRLETSEGRTSPATDEEVQGIVDKLRTPVQKRRVVGVLGWNSFVPQFAFETADLPTVSKLEDIPVSERAKIEAALGRSNIKATPEKILQTYNGQLAALRKR